MSDVQFDESGGYVQNYSNEDEIKGLIGLVLKTGIAKDRRQANIVLIFVIVVSVVVATGVFIFSKSGGPIKPTYIQQIRLKSMPLGPGQRN